MYLITLVTSGVVFTSGNIRVEVEPTLYEKFTTQSYSTAEHGIIY
jgi:hypothetical protein